ncbi:hypothetical protein [Rhizobium sp. GN54]|uniref:hypothetical protein n=1 Tax=Rhizobium sp. GN54 TaxID=2898150 RepID=UPI001E489D92|nr:hypothetical protein [Rhizobium sp. GN54]MCD2181850.1 hypothetical protein [Rhizobium sp. GN54]
MNSAAQAAVIRAHVDEILSSRTFARSGRLRAFLDYVVECALAGKAGQLKGYTIGIDVFGRPVGFDAGSDPIVRVQAGKLRKLLDQYYDVEGARAPLRIRIPLGSYAPQIAWERRSPSQAGASLAAAAAPAPDPVPQARRRRNLTRGTWRPAPISSHLALFTLLPMLLLAPAPHSGVAITAIANTRIHVEKARATIGLGGRIPVVGIERCWPGTGICRQLADAIEKAIGYYRTVQLGDSRKSGDGDPLAYRIRIEAQGNGETMYARLIHAQSGLTVHAEQFRAADLNEATISYEAFTFAGRILSANGRIYLHAQRLGAASPTMRCLQEADRRREPGSDCLHLPLMQASTGPETTDQPSTDRLPPLARAL